MRLLNNFINLFVLCITVFLSFQILNCGTSTANSNDAGTPFTTLSHQKTVTLTTAEEYGSARPEIVAASKAVYVIYLGNIINGGGDKTFRLKVFDKTLDRKLNEKVLVSASTFTGTADIKHAAAHGLVTDIRVASDDEAVYGFYESVKTTFVNGQPLNTTFLWRAKWALNDSFDLLASSAEPITSSTGLTASNYNDSHELVDDPLPIVGPNSVFVVTRIANTITLAGNTVFKVREYKKGNLAPLRDFILDLSAVANGRARLSAGVYFNGAIYMAFPTTTADQNAAGEAVAEFTDDGARSDIIAVKMTDNGSTWAFDTTDVWTLTDEVDAVDNYVSGFDIDSSYVYLTYKRGTGGPPNGSLTANIRIFDINFNRLLTQEVKKATWGPGGGEIRPSFDITDQHVISGQSSSTKNAELFMYLKQ